jgi:4-hydroxy-tetrahydrodipicolinate reductase
MNIALIGFGKMGKTIHGLGVKQGHSFPLIIDLENRESLQSDEFRNVDVAIEFTTPDSAVDNIITCFKQAIPVVTGTTGWNERRQEVEQACRKMNGGLFHASNFSIGVNILFAMNKKLAQIMNNYSQYHTSVEEVHHVHKLDAPSGTAITLADQIIHEIEPLKIWRLKQPGLQERTEESSVLEIHALREGEVKGRHSIQYESEVDSITLMHEAKSRDAFANGVLMAAEFMVGKKGVFGMNDLLKF